MRAATAALTGAVLFTLPFQLYLHGGPHRPDASAPHADHEAHHGGTLVMVDDHHLEVVARGGRVEVFTTDAVRRPVRPVRATVVFDDGTTVPLVWRLYRLAADTPPTFAWADYEVQLGGGPVLSVRVPFVDEHQLSITDPK